LRKLRNKRISLLLAIVFLMTVVFPMSAFAASTDYNTVTAPKVTADTDNAKLGTMQVKFSNGYDGGKSQARVELPDGFDINDVSVSDDTYAEISDINNNGFLLTFDAPSTVDSKYLKFNISFDDVDVPKDAAEGAIKASLDSISGQLFDGSITIGYVIVGEMRVDCIDEDSFSDEGGTVTIRIEESAADTMTAGDDVEIQLPNGLEWGNIDSVSYFGNLVEADWIIDTDNEEMTVTVKNGTNSDTRSGFDIKIDVDVEDDIDEGEIIADVGGDYDVDNSEITLGYYGDYATDVTAEKPSTEIYCGRILQDVSDITFEEVIADSLQNGRTIKLTLPENARWNEIDGKNVKALDNDYDEDLQVTDEDEGVYLEFTKLTNDDRTLQLKIVGDSKDQDKAELTLEDITVMTQAGVTGDLKVQIDSSSSNMNPDEVTIAKVVNPISVTAEIAPVEIGYQGQLAGSIVITETKKEAIRDDNALDDNYSDWLYNARAKGSIDENPIDEAWLMVTLPRGLEFDGKPDVKVTKGNLKIEDVMVDNDGWESMDVDDDEWFVSNEPALFIQVTSDSSQASEITINNLKLNVDRTRTYGDIKAKVTGNAIFDWETYEDYYSEYYDDEDYPGGYWNDYAQATFVAASVQTPAPATQKISFKMGDEGITVANGRVLVQVNKLTEVLGLQKSWDAATKTAYFVKDGSVVAFPMGENAIFINGAKMPVDQGGKIINDFTYATLRGIQMAFGGELTWDNTTKTATFTFEGRAN